MAAKSRRLSSSFDAWPSRNKLANFLGNMFFPCVFAEDPNFSKEFAPLLAPAHVRDFAHLQACSIEGPRFQGVAVPPPCFVFCFILREGGANGGMSEGLELLCLVQGELLATCTNRRPKALRFLRAPFPLKSNLWLHIDLYVYVR